MAHPAAAVGKSRVQSIGRSQPLVRPAKRGLGADGGSLETHPSAEDRSKRSKQAAAASAAVPVATTKSKVTHFVFNQGLIEAFRSDGASIATIRRIVQTLHETNVLVLPLKSSFLKTEGEKVSRVHPLCFLWCLLSDSTSKRFLQEMHRGRFLNGLKWQGFLGTSKFHDKGITKELDKVYVSVSPDDFLEDFRFFCKEMSLDFGLLEPSIHSKNWPEFVERLFH